MKLQSIVVGFLISTCAAEKFHCYRYIFPFMGQILIVLFNENSRSYIDASPNTFGLLEKDPPNVGKIPNPEELGDDEVYRLSSSRMEITGVARIEVVNYESNEESFITICREIPSKPLVVVNHEFILGALLTKEYIHVE